MLLGIAQLDISGKREILALRVAGKAIIGEDAAQVLVALEQHAIHVEHFTLEPARDGPDARDGGDRLVLVRPDMDADAVVLRHAQQAIDDLEARIAIGPVDPGDFHQLLVIERIAQLHHAAEQFLALHDQRDLAIGFDSIDKIVAQRLARGLDHALVRSIFRSGVAHRSTVPTRRIFRCSCMMP